ncbi:MAG: prepilin peptidase [Actinomycetota bacterium]|nr:prepilin peptidase [Actinomycetota bacterium]
MVTPSEILTVAYLLFGAAVGSFLNVVIYRLPLGMSVASPPSRCSSCGYQLKPWDNIPIISYLILRGKCRSCSRSFGASYVFVELLNLLVWTLLLVRLGLTFLTLIEAFFSSLLLASSAIDINTRTIPRKLIYVGTVIVVVLSAVYAVAKGDIGVLERALFLGAISFLVFILIFFASRGSLGFGDVRLSFVIGFSLGIFGARLVIDFFYIAFASAAAYGITLLMRKRAGRKTKIPFGPFMSLGAFAGLMLLNSLRILG